MTNDQNCISWSRKPIGDLLDAVIDYRGKTPPKSPRGIPTLTAANVKNGRIDLSKMSYVSRGTYETWITRGLPKPGDVLITTEAPVGEVASLPDDQTYLITRRVIALRGKPSELDNDFLKYSLLYSGNRDRLLASVRGSTVPRVLKPDILGLELSIPSYSEQVAVASVLRALDDKIELDRQMSHTLEAIARAIFKSWFVNFDPVWAKAESRTLTGMDAETATLFPAAFVESELGLIPEGWRIDVLGNVIHINERSIKKDYPHKTIEYIDISSVTEGKLEGTTSYALFEAPSRAKRLVQHGDTIWSTVRPNRKSYLFIHTPQDNLVVSTGFAVLSPRSIPATYLYSWVITEEFVGYLVQNASGSAYPAVRAERFFEAEFLIPSSQVLNRFDELVRPIRDRIAYNERESRTLAELRDILLPRLISGQLRVPDAEKLVGEIQ